MDIVTEITTYSQTALYIRNHQIYHHGHRVPDKDILKYCELISTETRLNEDGNIIVVNTHKITSSYGKYLLLDSVDRAIYFERSKRQLTQQFFEKVKNSGKPPKNLSEKLSNISYEKLISNPLLFYKVRDTLIKYFRFDK